MKGVVRYVRRDFLLLVHRTESLETLNAHLCGMTASVLWGNRVLAGSRFVEQARYEAGKIPPSPLYQREGGPV